jgi:hypothetical protein
MTPALHPRQGLSKRELLALLNWELAAYEQCEGAHFTSIRTMRERDDAGCNWLDARVASNHPLGVDEHFIVCHVVEETRRKFDLRTH